MHIANNAKWENKLLSFSFSDNDKDMHNLRCSVGKPLIQIITKQIHFFFTCSTFF